MEFKINTFKESPLLYQDALAENHILQDVDECILGIPKSQDKLHLSRCGKTKGTLLYKEEIITLTSTTTNIFTNNALQHFY